MRAQIVALRDIAGNESITINYSSSQHSEFDSRQRSLLSRLYLRASHCRCVRCVYDLHTVPWPRKEIRRTKKRARESLRGHVDAFLQKHSQIAIESLKLLADQKMSEGTSDGFDEAIMLLEYLIESSDRKEKWSISDNIGMIPHRESLLDNYQGDVYYLLGAAYLNRNDWMSCHSTWMEGIHRNPSHSLLKDMASKLSSYCHVSCHWTDTSR